MPKHTPKVPYSTPRDHTYSPYSQTFDPRGLEDGQNQAKSRKTHFLCLFAITRYFFDLHNSLRESEMQEHTPQHSKQKTPI